MLPPKLPETDRDERVIPCVTHPDRRAVMLDGGRGLCEECWFLAWRTSLRAQARAQQLVQGGLPHER